MSKVNLREIAGSGDVVAFFEALAEQAREGDIEAVAVVTVEADGTFGHGWTHKTDLPHPWSMLTAGVTSLQYELLSVGL